MTFSPLTMYDEGFFESQQYDSKESAKAIVPILIDLLNPGSVVDVGCGVGTWLSVFMEHGIRDVLGIDGSYVEKDMLHIPEENFVEHNLESPIKANRTFDLVISLEVAEHIQEQHAETFVDTLVNLGKVVLFSAAVPQQSGVGHVNEQWPDYWIHKFRNRDYVVLDIIRPMVWNHIRNRFWYNQNMMLFIEEQTYSNNEKYSRFRNMDHFYGYSMVHPELYLLKLKELNNVYYQLFKKLFDAKLYSLITELNKYISKPITDYFAGRACKELGDYKASIVCLERYLTDDSATYKLSALFHLAEAYYLMGNFAEARQRFLECIRLSGGVHQMAMHYLEKIGD